MDLKGIKLTWLGHATFRIETGGQTVLVDPWVMGNPLCPEKEKKIRKVDVMLCTHGHFDHIGDAVEIAKQHNPTVVGIFELCAWLEKKGAKKTSPMNKGGTQAVGDIRVTMVHADHSCGILDGDQIIYGGEACGFVIEFQNGLKIYHAGDTAVFGDLQIIRELYAPDIALLPIGDHYVMSPREAAYACKLLKPKAVVPMHFGTFPVLSGTPAQLKNLAKDVEVVEMKPGQTL
ncbi:MAG TPA: metal-dependent hydrolase [Terriglobales bacterium]|jgi:L-ascorbate metabolism protein UlaG (beta-lactamase superfamily)|nr:metal-dependent hydrolase [Terriglobales bacterium]HET7750056.1 metal-dependent hydrolase [Terriglobales bacterium]